MKIAVAGIGYVGLSLAVLLARQHDVVSVDINERRVAMLNRGDFLLSGMILDAWKNWHFRRMWWGRR